MKIKIVYVEAENIEKLQEVVNKELDALQMNVRNKVVEVKTLTTTDGYAAQIAYAELEGAPQEILMEGDAVNVPKN